MTPEPYFRSNPRFDRRDYGTHLERMVMAREVAWFRNADGTFTVTWTMNGNARVAVFKREDSAIRFANLLDTTDALPTETDVVLAEESLQELERAAEGPEESRLD